MNKRIAFLATALAIAGLAARLAAVDIGANFQMANMGFPWDQTTPTTAAYSPLEFIYGGNLTISQKVMDSLHLVTEYSLDATQRSMLEALVRYDASVLQIGLGPIFGVFNNLDSPLTAGIASSVRVDVPGVVFMSFRNHSSLGADLSAIGDNTQELSEIRLGWYVRNAICSVSMQTRSFKVQESASLVTTDSYADYCFQVDIYKKNQPYNLLLNLGYRAISKEFSNAGTSTKDSLGLVIVGFQCTIRPSAFYDIVLGLDSAVYSFGFDDMALHGPDMDSSYLFSAKIGFNIRTEAIPKKAKVSGLESVEVPLEQSRAKDLVKGANEGEDKAEPEEPQQP